VGARGDGKGRGVGGRAAERDRLDKRREVEGAVSGKERNETQRGDGYDNSHRWGLRGKPSL